MTLTTSRLPTAGSLQKGTLRGVHGSRPSIRVPRHIRRGLALLHAVVGIDLGTSNSAIGSVDEGEAKIVATSDGPITNSWVAFTEVRLQCPSRPVIEMRTSANHL